MGRVKPVSTMATKINDPEVQQHALCRGRRRDQNVCILMDEPPLPLKEASVDAAD